MICQLTVRILQVRIIIVMAIQIIMIMMTAIMIMKITVTTIVDMAIIMAIIIVITRITVMVMSPAVIILKKVIIVTTATVMIIPIVKRKNKKESDFADSQRGMSFNDIPFSRLENAHKAFLISSERTESAETQCLLDQLTIKIKDKRNKTR